MTNKSSSKQHGLNGVKRQQPKSKLRFRANKQKAAVRKAERRKVTTLSRLVKLDVSEKVNQKAKAA